jgi:hypothetical protein
MTTATTSGQLVSLERSRFFPRQLVGPDDLTQDQIYFREKLRRHNRMLHGWGIVCGACVTADGCEAVVTPGYILGPYGDEIMIERQTRIDVCNEDSTSGLDCVEPDAWCGERPRVKEGRTAYLAVRYAELPSRPVRAPGCGCGCEETGCEYSRTRDGFELAVLTQLPASYRRKSAPDIEESWSCTDEHSRDKCPECPSDPWVILSNFTLENGEMQLDDRWDTHRRYVVSFARYAYRCRDDDS